MNLYHSSSWVSIKISNEIVSTSIVTACQAVNTVKKTLPVVQWLICGISWTTRQTNICSINVCSLPLSIKSCGFLFLVRTCHIIWDWSWNFFLLFICIRMGGDEKDRHPASPTTSICHITLPWQQDAMMWYESLNTLMLLFGVVRQCLPRYLFIWWREAYLSTQFALSVQDFKRWY